MAYIGKPEELSTQPNFLKSATVTAFTTTVKESDGGSEKVVKAGTIYPKNDATAKGVIYNDVDVSHGDQEASLIVEGHLLADRLPEKPSEEAKQVLRQIEFY